MEFTNGYALLIGVGQYQHNSYEPYAETAGDAQAVSAVLRDPQRCGYPEQQVKLLLNDQATRQAFLDALEDLRSKTTPDATVFIFYSGHGDFGAEGSSGPYYLTTYDTRRVAGALDPQTALSEQELLGKIRQLQARRVFMFFNACFAGQIPPALGAESEAMNGENVPERLAVALSAGEGRVIITACRENQKSYLDEPPTQMTFFGQAFEAALRGEGITPHEGYISVLDLYGTVYSRVKDAVWKRWFKDQEPELTINKAVGILPLALYQSPPPASPENDQQQPRVLSGQVRMVEAAEAERMQHEIMRGNFNVKAQNIERSTIVQTFINNQQDNRTTFEDKVTTNTSVVQNSHNTNVRDISNNSGAINFGNNSEQTINRAQPSQQFKANTYQLNQIMSRKLQRKDMSLLALQIENYNSFQLDPSALPSDLSESVTIVVAQCSQHKAMKALIQSLIDRSVIDTNTEVWLQWAEDLDARTPTT